MSNLVAIFNTNQPMTLPDYARAPSGVTSDLLGGLSGGRDRISVKNSRFRLIQNGQEVAVKNEPFLDVIIVAASPAVSRIYYEGKFDPTVKAPPTCFSADGVSPHPESVKKQAANCASCKQNEKGSRIAEDGSKTRACSFKKRLAVVLPGDPEQRVYQLDAAAMSIFGTGNPTKGEFSLQEYGQKLALHSMRASAILTRLSLDLTASVPKLFFSPLDFLTEEQARAIDALAQTPAVKDIVTVDAASLTSEPGEAGEGFETPAPTQAAPATTTVVATSEAPPVNAPAGDDELASQLAALGL